MPRLSMRTRLIIAAVVLTAAALAASECFAQSSVTPYVGNGNTGTGQIIYAPVGTCTTCIPMPVTSSSSGGAIITKPDASVSTGYQQITSLAASTTVTPGAGSTYCIITPEVQAASLPLFGPSQSNTTAS